jgi:hypothetical protein
MTSIHVRALYQQATAVQAALQASLLLCTRQFVKAHAANQQLQLQNGLRRMLRTDAENDNDMMTPRAVQSGCQQQTAAEGRLMPRHAWLLGR